MTENWDWKITNLAYQLKRPPMDCVPPDLSMSTQRQHQTVKGGNVCVCAWVWKWSGSSKAMDVDQKILGKKKKLKASAPAPLSFVYDGMRTSFRVVTFFLNHMSCWFGNIPQEQWRLCQCNSLRCVLWTLWVLSLYGYLFHQLTKDASGSQGPESGYCSLSNLNLKPAPLA